MTSSPVKKLLSCPSLFILCTALFAAGLHAQPTKPASAQGPVVASAQPRYAAKDIERAFSFMDANKDGRISREEAAGFRGVAKHFDEADTNKDRGLSREEFESALNREKTP